MLVGGDRRIVDGGTVGRVSGIECPKSILRGRGLPRLRVKPREVLLVSLRQRDACRGAERNPVRQPTWQLRRSIGLSDGRHQGVLSALP